MVSIIPKLRTLSPSPLTTISNVDKTLKPKLEILPEIVLYGSDLAKFANALLLQNIGFSDLKLRKFILHHPRIMMRKAEWLEDIVHRVETDFGIPRESAMFIHEICAVSSFSQSTLAEKVDVYRSFGWSDAHISTMARKLPFCFCLSEAKICKQLTFLMKEVGCTSEYLASRPKLLMYSLEKRVIPRYKVLKSLHGKRLNRGLGFCSAACMTPSKFMKEVMYSLEKRVIPLRILIITFYVICYRDVSDGIDIFDIGFDMARPENEVAQNSNIPMSNIPMSSLTSFLLDHT